jgi:hypothetical protein
LDENHGFDVDRIFVPCYALPDTYLPIPNFKNPFMFGESRVNTKPICIVYTTKLPNYHHFKSPLMSCTYTYKQYHPIKKQSDLSFIRQQR